MNLPMPDGAVPQFSKDAIPLDLDESLGGNAWAFFRKTQSTKAIRINRPFAVITIHGGDAQLGAAGDWLAIDAEGHPYPIADSVFRASFVPTLPVGMTATLDHFGGPATPQGEPPAEGTRRRLILEAVESIFDGATSPGPPSDVSSLAVADAVEIALQSAEAQPTGPAYESPSVPVIITAREQLQSVSDVDRGRLLEMVGGATGVVGALVRSAADQLEGFPPDVQAAAFLLAALGIADQAGEP